MAAAPVQRKLAAIFVADVVGYSRLMARDEDIVQAALWLASDAAEWVTGHALVVDGGVMTGTNWNPTSPMREELRALAEDKA